MKICFESLLTPFTSGYNNISACFTAGWEIATRSKLLKFLLISQAWAELAVKNADEQGNTNHITTHSWC